MDSDSSSKFIGSLTKFLQSLCNGYVEFETGVELIGHIYLSVDSGKQSKKIDYILNEKVCKNDNSVTFISNSFHAHPLEKSKPPSGKKASDEDGRREDEGGLSDSGDVPRSTNSATVPARTAARSAASPNQNRVAVGSKRPGSPMKGPSTQRRPSSPLLRRQQLQGSKGPVGSPASTKTVPSSPSSSSQDNIPSPSARLKSRADGNSATQISTDDAGVDPDLDGLVPANLMPIHPSAAPDLSSFLGDEQAATSQEQRPGSRDEEEDTKPDTDVTFIKEEFMAEPSSCAQAGGSSHRSGRSGDDQLLQDSSGLYPVMLHQNTAAFPGLPSGFPPSSSSSQHPSFAPSTSTSSADPFANPVPGTSQDGSDPSDKSIRSIIPGWRQNQMIRGNMQRASPGSRTPRKSHICRNCGKSFMYSFTLTRHMWRCLDLRRLLCHVCNHVSYRLDTHRVHLMTHGVLSPNKRHRP